MDANNLIAYNSVNRLDDISIRGSGFPTRYTSRNFGSFCPRLTCEASLGKDGNHWRKEERMSLVKWAKNRIEKNRKSRRAISTIMANLMMLVIVVTLSSLLFVWAISSFGAYQGGAGYWFSSRSIANQERPSVENAYFTGSCGTCNNIVKVYVRNVGTIPFTIASVYMNSTLFQFQQTVNVGNVTTTPLTLTLTGQTWAHNDIQKITVATTRGTTVTTTWVS